MTIEPVKKKSRVPKFEFDGKEITLCQARIISLTLQCLQRKQIAAYLGNSKHTIDSHISRIYSILNINDSSQAILWALENGFDRQGSLNSVYLFEGFVNMPWEQVKKAG